MAESTLFPQNPHKVAPPSHSAESPPEYLAEPSNLRSQYKFFKVNIFILYYLVIYIAHNRIKLNYIPLLCVLHLLAEKIAFASFSVRPLGSGKLTRIHCSPLLK